MSGNSWSGAMYTTTPPASVCRYCAASGGSNLSGANLISSGRLGMSAAMTALEMARRPHERMLVVMELIRMDRLSMWSMEARWLNGSFLVGGALQLRNSFFDLLKDVFHRRFLIRR